MPLRRYPRCRCGRPWRWRSSEPMGPRGRALVVSKVRENVRLSEWRNFLRDRRKGVRPVFTTIRSTRLITRRSVPCRNALPASSNWSRPSAHPHRLRQESVPDAGQDYCHDHIIRAAAATGVITGVRAGAVDGLDRRGPRRQAGGQEALRSHRTGERTLGRGLEQDHPGGRGVGAQCPQDGAR